MVQSPPRTNPFPGLRPFELGEEHLFFGREGQADELLTRLRRTRFLAVVGTSGSGKSSLVRAGLLPSLLSGLMPQASSSWRVAILRPGGGPVANLAAALNDPDVFGVDPASDDAVIRTALTESTLRRGALGLVEVAQQARMADRESLLVVVDQFEELFRFKAQAQGPEAEDEAAAFVKLLLGAVNQRDVPIFVVLTMRSDFLGDCAQFRDLPETLNDSQYLIPRLTREQLRRAIEGPVAVGGATITPRLVNRLLNDTGDNPDQLPILQHALMRTWDHWEDQGQPKRAIDIEDYEAIGGMAEALSRHADQIYDGLPDDKSRQIAETLFRRLTDRGPDNRDIRRPTTLAELCAVATASEAEVMAVADEFRGARRSFLMPSLRVPLRGDTVIDISHESLMRNWQQLKLWSNKEAQSARIYYRLAETARLYKEGKAELLRDPELAIVWDWKNLNDPSRAWAMRYDPDFEQSIHFLEESIALRYGAIQNRVKYAIEQEIESQGHFDAFVSYHRKDNHFVRKLRSELKKHNLKTWLDFENIPAGVDWRKEVTDAIAASDNFIFVISPDSAASQYCNLEIENAVKNQKRIIPILLKSSPEYRDSVHPIIRSINWISFLEEESFEDSLDSLVSLLRTNLQYIKAHTKLLDRALEWQQKDRDSSFLLRGNELVWAEKWLVDSQTVKDPAPTELQRQYIATSLQESRARLRLTRVRNMTLIVLFFLSSIFAFGSAKLTRVILQQQAEIERLGGKSPSGSR
ncbi:TIR domain-containing protein [Nodosilinea sp. PGN35]|uniref:toll/interleukin-1 receptor domain-containing protein n=1 Tax=Nodosilinea sp. PGN35 TaxID=3020489 RepID=UPI0023B2512B|nr:TIR domain-containing protein [Nodosilinea sp. TSF1-S3]MDF0367015.1 TIR domain-containing protein [Nodosilinea sp. TSF1-S3]